MFLSHLAQDIRFALRGFRKSPVFTAVAILSLAIGIGANAAIFSLINQLILRPLPVRDPQRLVLLAGRGRHYGSNNGRNALSYPMYEDIRDRNQVFDGMMCRYGMTFTVGTSSMVEVVGGELVSGNYFPLLGVNAARGRVFTAGDDLHPGAHPWAVLSYAYWQSRFGGSRSVLGQTIRVDNYPLTIVGVARRGFDGMEPGLPAQIFVPMAMTQNVRPLFTSQYDRRQRWVNVYGRLKPGITVERAKAGLQPLFHQIISMEVTQPGFTKASAYARQEFLRMWMDAMPGSQGNTEMRQKFEAPLWMLMGMVALVLLIACVNLASLLTARAAARRKEIAIRLAVGSGRGRLVQQLLTESVLLAAIGGVAGIGLAVLSVRTLLGFLPINATGYDIASTPDLRVILFTAGVALLAGVSFGLIPALQAAHPDLASTLKDQAEERQGGGVHFGFRKVLVAFQIALSLVLLIGAGSFVRSLGNLETEDPGFRTSGILEFGISPRMAGYDPDRAVAFLARTQQRLAAIPGVISSGLIETPLLYNYEWDQWVTIEGHPNTGGNVPDPHFDAVSPGYFQTMGIHILSGRGFAETDTRTSPAVAIVNQKFAKRYFGSVPAVGMHIGLGGDPGTKTDVPIVGVVNDTRYENLREDMPEQVYLCENQRPVYGDTVYLLTRGDPRSLMGPVRAAMRDLDPNLPLTNMKTFDRQIAESLVTERLTATLATIFGAVATALALIGLYGVMSFLVTRRSREIGIRMALGAMAGSVVWIVVQEALILVAAGFATGLPSAWALTRVVSTQLYGIQPGDPASIAFAVLLLAAVTAAAAFIPARRAVSFDPWRILRHE